jgi:hypothetical protein
MPRIQLRARASCWTYQRRTASIFAGWIISSTAGRRERLDRAHDEREHVERAARVRLDPALVEDLSDRRGMNVVVDHGRLGVHAATLAAGIDPGKFSSYSSIIGRYVKAIVSVHISTLTILIASDDASDLSTVTLMNSAPKNSIVNS